jgi:hypothetical protein
VEKLLPDSRKPVQLTRPSFWDDVPDMPDAETFDSLVAADPPNFEKIIGHPELLQAFRMNGSSVRRILVIPAHMQKVIQLILPTRTSNLLARQSSCISLPKIGEFFIQQVEKSDLVRSGFVSRIFKQRRLPSSSSRHSHLPP